MDPRIRIRIHTKMSWICNTGYVNHSRAKPALLRSVAEERHYLYLDRPAPRGWSRTESLWDRWGGGRPGDPTPASQAPVHPTADPAPWRQQNVLIISQTRNVADPDPGSGAFLTPGSGMGKKSRSGSGMNIPDHISESLETILWVKILKFFDADADPGIIWSGREKFGSQIRYGMNIPDPQHCRREYFCSLIQYNNRRKESNLR